MINLFIKIFIKDYENTSDPKVRIKYGNFASVTGIICNLFLCFSKAIVGILFNSVAIIADAINNLTDAANSVISYIGFVISGKPADKDHPYGHARYEYLTCLLVSFVILLLGLSLFKTSFMKIIHPELIKVNFISIIILLFSVLIKLWMSFFYKKIGIKINSSVLIANSIDSLNDVVSTSVVFVTIIIAMFTGLNFDGIAGCLVSLFIIYSGIKVLKSTINDLIGTTPEPELINNIISKLKSYDDVKGIHDLVVHNYGPGNYFATVHVEVSSSADILSSHDMIDDIERDFYNELNINLVIHIDPIVTDDSETNEAKCFVTEALKSINDELSIHDFRIVKKDCSTNLVFDVLVPDDVQQNDDELIEIISKEIKKHNDNYEVVVTIDRKYA